MNATRTERTPSRQVLAELAARVVVFLKAVGTHDDVHAAMKKAGYTVDDDREGWDLLRAAFALRADAPVPPDDGPARGAIAAIGRWVSGNFGRLMVAVERLHPDEMQLFDGIDASAENDAEAVVLLAKLLERVREREASGGERAVVVETLERRGFTRSERARLADLVLDAQQAPAIEYVRPTTRDAEVIALYRWFTDWSTTARAVIGRKDYLVALGLSGRRRSGTRGSEQ